MLARGDQAGPPVALVVGVRARGEGREAALLRECGERVVELALAVVAAVGAVGAVAGTGQLVRGDDLVRDADRLGDRACARQLAARECGGDRRHGQGAVAQRALRQRRDERGVDPARERHDDAAELAQSPLDALLGGVHASTSAAASAAAQTLLTGPAERRGRPRAVVVLGSEVDDLAVEQAELDAHAVAVDGHVPEAPFQLQPLVARHAHAERRGLAHDRLGHGARVGGSRQRGQHDAGASLLHQHGRRPHVQGPRGERARSRIGHQLARRVVEVGLDHDHLAARAWPARPARPRARARRSAPAAGRGCRRRSRRPPAPSAGSRRSAPRSPRAAPPPWA